MFFQKNERKSLVVGHFFFEPLLMGKNDICRNIFFTWRRSTAVSEHFVRQIENQHWMTFEIDSSQLNCVLPFWLVVSLRPQILKRKIFTNKKGRDEGFFYVVIYVKGTICAGFSDFRMMYKSKHYLMGVV